MAAVYANLIRKGKKTINDVPEKLRAEVEALLNAQTNALIFNEKGYIYHGNNLRNAYYQREKDFCSGSGEIKSSGKSDSD